jgi:hypothetical protein
MTTTHTSSTEQDAGRRLAPADLDAAVCDALRTTTFIDVHTHLYSPALGTLGLWGIDDLLTYHYLEAEFFRYSSMRPDRYWTLPKSRRADLIWSTLFVDNTPLSEAARGVVGVLHALGLESGAPSLAPLREFFRAQNPAEYVPRIFRLAGVSHVVMTNDPLDPEEASIWNGRLETDERFLAALRLDRIVNEWDRHHERLAAEGYAVEADAGAASIAEVRRFLTEWIVRVRPRYMAVSLPHSFVFPGDDARTRLLSDAVLPACREHHLPLALMIGVRRQVNPALRLAGDASGVADMHSIGVLCRRFPENRFMVSALSRENQHELCVYARKFGNLLPFGCWWFLNSPSIVEEITKERLEMLGTSFIPQHSDARVLEQLLYKWSETRRTLAPILARTYGLLVRDGRAITDADIRRDVTRLFRTNFERWTGPVETDTLPPARVP